MVGDEKKRSQRWMEGTQEVGDEGIREAKDAQSYDRD